MFILFMMLKVLTYIFLLFLSLFCQRFDNQTLVRISFPQGRPVIITKEEFLNSLPKFVSPEKETTYHKELLERLIAHKLFILEAQNRDSLFQAMIDNSLKIKKEQLLIQKIIEEVISSKVGPQDKAKAKAIYDSFVQELTARRRLEYNPNGLALFHKNPDSLTETEKETWIAKKDGNLFVKARNLMHIAQKFPSLLDTAIRTLAIKRAIEDELFYEEALNRRLDQKPEIQKELAKIRDELAYQILFQVEITNKVSVSDSELTSYYHQNQSHFPTANFEQIKGIVYQRVFTDKRDRIYGDFVQELKKKAKIEINQHLFNSLRKAKR